MIVGEEKVAKCHDFHTQFHGDQRFFYGALTACHSSAGCKLWVRKPGRFDLASICLHQPEELWK
jgi:hypothetical protein